MASALTQHHDAVTGTERQRVAEDYHERLASGIASTLNVTFASAFSHCPLLNESACDVTENNGVFTVAVYNPSSRNQSHYIKLPVVGSVWQVTLLPSGSGVASQTVPLMAEVLGIPGRTSTPTHELTFKAENLPPMATTFFKVELIAAIKEEIHMETLPSSRGQFAVNGFNFTLQPMFYTAEIGNNIVPENQASGAYIFRPVEDQPNPFSPGNGTVIAGSLFDETRETFGDYASQIVRLYHDSSDLFDVEISWLVGPIPVDDLIGKEVILKTAVNDMNNAGIFFTDSNGRSMMRRVRDSRHDYDLNGTDHEPVAQNYYPVTTRISINDGNGFLFVLNDRAQAGGSIEDGTIELLAHRRLLYDDAKGVSEPLNEPGVDGNGLVVRGTLYLQLSNDADSANMKQRLHGSALFSAPVLTFLPGEADQAAMNTMRLNDVALGVETPPNVDVLSFHPWFLDDQSPNKFFLLRLEHIFASGEHSTLSESAVVDVEALLASLGRVVDIRETNLAANEFLDDEAKREKLNRKWVKENEEVKSANVPLSRSTAFNVTLNAMDIRTFIVEIE